MATLETKLAGEGDLDSIIRLREEQEAVKKSGGTTSHSDKPLVELQTKYLTALKTITDESSVARGKVAADTAKRLKVQELVLAKAGNVDGALAFRKAGEEFLAELAASGAVVESKAPRGEFLDDPRLSEFLVIKPLKPIEYSTERPPVVEKPFLIQGRWLENMTMPLAKQRIAESVVIGDRMKQKWPLIVVQPGTVWTGSGSIAIELSGANFVATGARFNKVFMSPDHATQFNFVDCVLDDCGFGKGGVWYGGDQAAKTYFKNCLVIKRFGERMNVTDNGIRAEKSVFQGIDFHSFRFRKNQPANYVNHEWLRLVNCRFVDCRVPLSILLLTRECVFENCTFLDDKNVPDDEEPITKAMEIIYYTRNSRGQFLNLPEKVKLTEKRDTDLKGVVIPTVSSFTL